MTSFLRPDEAAAQSEIERSSARDRKLKGGLKTAIGIGTSLAGGALASKVAPFLSEFIPAELAMKGINKVAPKLGEFLRRGTEMGLDVKEGLDYIKSNLQPAKENRSIIEQYSPELHQFIGDQIKRGRSPLEAGAIARADKKFESAIKKIETDHKAPWSSILQTVYGEGQGAPQQQSTQQQMSQNQQQDQGDAALMAIMQKILQSGGPGG